MARRKVISDHEVTALLHGMLMREGERALTFQSAAAATGLSAPTLVQRFGTRDAMLLATLRFGWERLAAFTAIAEAEAPRTPKGAQGFLKVVATADNIPVLQQASLADPDLQERAAAWRAVVETALASRLGKGNKARVAAGLLFAVWQGRLLWGETGGKTVKLGDAFRLIAGED